MTGPVTRSPRRESRDLVGKFRSAVSAPVMCVPMMPGEGGMVTQAVSFECDPVAGRMMSEAYCKVTVLYIPAQAIHKMLHKGNAAWEDKAGVTEIMRRMIMNKTPIFPGRVEDEITQRMGIVPMKVSNVTQVSSVALLGYNVAQNYMRKRKYIYATERAGLDQTLAPAVLHETVLERFRAAMDPDDHINGKVELNLSQTQAPVTGIGILSNDGSPVNRARRETKGAVSTGLAFQVRSNSDGALQNAATLSIAAQTNNATSLPAIYADLQAVMASGFSLVDLYNAQKADDLVRQMRAIANDNPTYGEEAVLRWAFGLNVDGLTEPFVLYEKEIALGDAMRRATDAAGIQQEVRASDLGAMIEYSIPVPKTELGGLVITLAQIRPDEVIAQQPHPILTTDWTMPSQPAEMMMVDPEPVMMRELFGDTTATAQETQIKFYAGHNQLKRHYVNVGFTRNTNVASVANKNVMWTYAIPAGVTPDNILYPVNFPQYPWLDQNAEICTYRVASQAVIDTDYFFGPDPVETVAIVDSRNLLG